jgi:hypothetical protein
LDTVDKGLLMSSRRIYAKNLEKIDIIDDSTSKYSKESINAVKG